ncbi:unnamed protein product [Amoebophrya sp. A120]|nr:unnamed protein product [Amoebophrya sp. A120]|eukprot:GSA120T00016404001.1
MRLFLPILSFLIPVANGILLSNKQEPPACANIECAPLKCPTGFDEKQEPGTCCPVCFNPDIKLEAKLTGATGEFGGSESTFCKGTWCFPTLCPSEEKITAPTTTNGQCCPVCNV